MPVPAPRTRGMRCALEAFVSGLRLKQPVAAATRLVGPAGVAASVLRSDWSLRAFGLPGAVLRVRLAVRGNCALQRRGDGLMPACQLKPRPWPSRDCICALPFSRLAQTELSLPHHRLLRAQAVPSARAPSDVRGAKACRTCVVPTCMHARALAASSQPLLSGLGLVGLCRPGDGASSAAARAPLLLPRAAHRESSASRTRRCESRARATPCSNGHHRGPCSGRRRAGDPVGAEARPLSHS